jgi:hypothetical protein
MNEFAVIRHLAADLAQRYSCRRSAKLGGASGRLVLPLVSPAFFEGQ